MSKALFILLLIPWLSVRADCLRGLTVHIDLDAPSSFKMANNDLVGMDVDMLERIAADVKCQIRWHTDEMSGARVLRSIEEGQFDAIIRASLTNDRLRYAHFSIPYRDEVVGLYALRSTQLVAFNNLNEAFRKGLRMIGPAAGFYGEEYDALREPWQQSGRMTQYKNPVTATQLLFIKPPRGDLLLVDADVFFHHVGKQRVDLVFNPANWLRITPAHIMFSKKTVAESTVKRIDSAIQSLQQQGVLMAIEKRYRPPILMQEIAQARKR